MLALLCISISIFTYIPQAIRFFAFLYNFLEQAYNTTELTFCIAYFSRSPHPALPFMEMRLQLLFMAGIIALQITGTFMLIPMIYKHSKYMNATMFTHVISALVGKKKKEKTNKCYICTKIKAI